MIAEHYLNQAKLIGPTHLPPITLSEVDTDVRI